ncbi:MAG: hypothetical protein GF315_14770 [candidate division Zixibacteria bacterium]|nr:hypothetical protein [candidate division Zixibacteria bacterium]
MKFLKNMLFIMAVLMLSSILIVGCSEDSDNSTGQLTQGDLNDDELQTVEDDVTAQVEQIVIDLARGMSFIGGIGGQPHLAKATNDTSYYDSDSGWWVIYAEEDYGSYYYYYADSVRYSMDGAIQQYWDDGTDMMELKLYYGLSADTTSFNYEFEFYNDWVYTGVNSDTIETNGSGGYFITTNYNGEDYGYSYTADYDSVKIDVDDEYPHAGTVSATMSGYFYSEGEGYVEGTWTMEFTFYEEYYHVYISDGTYYWEWDEYWEEG